MKTISQMLKSCKNEEEVSNLLAEISVVGDELGTSLIKEMYKNPIRASELPKQYSESLTLARLYDLNKYGWCVSRLIRFIEKEDITTRVFFLDSEIWSKMSEILGSPKK